MPTYSSQPSNYNPLNYHPLNFGLPIDAQREDKILEDYIKSTWSLSNPDVNKIAWGKEPKEIMKYGKNNTLRCWLFASTQEQRWAVKTIKRVTPVRIEVAVIDRNVNNDHRSPLLTTIQRYLESWIVDNEVNLQNQGVHNIQHTNTAYVPNQNPQSNVYILNVDVDMTYF